MAISAGRQKGYFLLTLTAALAVIAFGFITAYSGLLAKKEQRALLDSQKAYLEQARGALQTAYEANAASVDSDASQAAYRDADTWLALAGVKRKWDLQLQVSNRLSRDGLDYTVLALWLPTETDATNPPAFDANTGTFTPCTSSSTACDPRPYIVVSGLTVQQKLQAKAIKQLNELASVHQSYFKARMLQDPERNLVVNYFRAPDGNCSNPYNMPCLDTYVPESQTSVVDLLGLSQALLTNPWGLPIEVSNLLDSSQAPPYSMSFKSPTPWGTFYTMSAIEPV